MRYPKKRNSVFKLNACERQQDDKKKLLSIEILDCLLYDCIMLEDGLRKLQNSAIYDCLPNDYVMLQDGQKKLQNSESCSAPACF